jgi:hypothetical protein
VHEVEQCSEERLVSLEMARAEAESSRVDLEKQFGDLKLEVNRINRFFERETMGDPQGRPSIFSGGESQSAAVAAKGFGGAHDVPPHEFRAAINPAHGTSRPIVLDTPVDSVRGRQLGVQGDSVCGNQGRLPKLNFPVFSGEDPQLWKYRCEKYFVMYGVEESLWISVASMHLEGVVARWFQSVERRLSAASWGEFCASLHERFGRDRHEALIRQLFHICQQGSVTEYVDQFSTLIDQLATYEAEANPLYYTMRFVDGLKDDIKSIVMI